MDPEAAAALLGVAPDAAPVDIERAWRRRSRDSHPDRFAEETGERRAQAAEEFIRVTRARDILLASRIIEQQDVPLSRDTGEWIGPPQPRWKLIGLWVALMSIGIFVAIYDGSFPLTVIDPIVRFGALVGGLVAYASTGRTRYFVIVVVAIAATALHAVLFTTLGTLLGMMLLGAPVIALVTLGQQHAERMRRASAR